MKFLVPGATEEAHEVMKLMFKVNPNKRPSAA
jgi:serine/threonine protein kinase